MRQPVYEDYEIKESGEVYSTKYKVRRKLKPWITSGYYWVNISHGGRVKSMKIHRLVALQYLPPQPSPKHEIRHLDGNRLNNNVSNLKWGTRRENCADTILHGRSNRGERCGISKLTEAQVVRIKFLKGKVERGYWTKLSQALGVHPSTISMILHNNSWGWLK